VGLVEEVDPADLPERRRPWLRRRASAAPRVASRPPALAPSLRPAVGAVVPPSSDPLLHRAVPAAGGGLTSSRVSERRTLHLAAPRGVVGDRLAYLRVSPLFQQAVELASSPRVSWMGVQGVQSYESHL